MTARKFVVSKFFEFPRSPAGHGRELNAKRLWDEKVPEALWGRRGIYVFCVRRPRSKLVPYYVGQAKKSFKQEVATPRNLNKYERALKHEKNVTPMIAFVVHPAGKTNVRCINEIEEFMIKAGRSVNANLQNINGGKADSWEIEGVTNSPRRRRKDEESSFKKLFDLR